MLDLFCFLDGILDIELLVDTIDLSRLVPLELLLIVVVVLLVLWDDGPLLDLDGGAIFMGEGADKR